jgi:hypothetical protein
MRCFLGSLLTDTQEFVQVMAGDDPAPACLDRAELAGTEQIVYQLAAKPEGFRYLIR